MVSSMDIYDSVGLRKPTSFALNLKRLPTELVHQVISELPLIKVLQILAHKEPHLDRCVLSHKFWRKLFTKQEDIDEIIDVFILFREICRFTNAPLVRPNTLLGLGGHVPVFGKETRAAHLKVHLQEAIRSALPLKKREIAMLETHATTPYPGHDADIATRWEWLKESKRNLNRAKSRQLTICADLMSRYPEKLILKKPLDPLQGPPRDNLKHIEDQLRHLAAQALQHNKFLFQDWNRNYNCKDAVDNIELVPYDRYLWFFIDMLKKYPVADDVGDEQPDQQKVTPYPYPPKTLAQIDFVLKGLTFVFTGCPSLIVKRVRWEGRKLATGPDSTKPAFEVELQQHSIDLPEEFHRCGVNKVMTYDEREYKWLLCFLKVVTWMEKEFEAVEVPVKKDGEEKAGP